VRDEVTLVVQVNGKLRGRIQVRRGCSQDEAMDLARQEERVVANLEGKTLDRVIYVKDRLLNLVLSCRGPVARP
jgi:leucyl-tRNA synthetase